MKRFLPLTLIALLSFGGAVFTARPQVPTKGDPFVKQPGAAKENSSVMELREFKIVPWLFNKIIGSETATSADPDAKFDACERLSIRGVTFPEGATATYLPTSGRLVVRNTVANLEAIERLIATHDDGQWSNVVLVLEVYALPKTDALAILESERGSTGRYQRVLDLEKEKKGHLAILTALTMKSGNKAITESIDEVRYPTEMIPGTAKGMPPTALTFETRNVGDTLEVEAVIGPDGHTCELSLVPQRISLAGFRELAAAPGDPPVAQPLFITQKLTTNTSLDSHAPHYLGSLTPPSENGIADGVAAEMWLAFLHLHVHGPAPDEVKHPEKPFDWSAMNLEYSVYSLDRAHAREILIAMPTLEAQWEKLQGLLREKQARFEHLTSIKTKSGQRATSEEIHELRYATEYAPPGHTRTTETTARTGKVRPGFPKKDLPEIADETTIVQRDIPNADGTPGAPASIETRNVGVVLEVEPVIGPDGQTIELSNMLNSIAHLGNLKTGRASVFLDQPLFQQRRVTTSQTVTAGRHMLIGTFNPPGPNGVNDRTDDGRTWLLFVRVLPNDP